MGNRHRNNQNDVDYRDDHPRFHRTEVLRHRQPSDVNDLFSADYGSNTAEADNPNEERNLSREHLPDNVRQDDVTKDCIFAKTERACTEIGTTTDSVDSR